MLYEVITTEELCSQIRYLVSLVENYCLGSGEELDEAFFLHREVCQQVMWQVILRATSLFQLFHYFPDFFGRNNFV